MILFIASFIAGALTVLAPCVLPLLPVVLGGSVSDAANRRRPLVIIAALSASVFAFTLLLKGSTALISVDPSFWTYVSAGIIGAFGLTLLFPETWARLVLRMPGHNKPESWMSRGYTSGRGFWGDVLVGAALGPVFTTCSPTFFLIVATVLPQSFAAGAADLVAYVLGLGVVLLLVAIVGQKLVAKLGWASNPYGWFRRVLGALFIILAIAIMLGFDKAVESDILSSGFFDVTTLEQSIRHGLEGNSGGNTASDADNISPAVLDGSATAPTGIFGSPDAAPAGSADQNVDHAAQISALASKTIPGERDLGRYIEIASPSGFVNSAPFKLADLVGKKVILIDFIDYSCINCERTFPYLAKWWSAYKDQGLEIVAIHTPEFAFEKDKTNVEAAARQFGLEFPIVLDNDYATWNAYRNQYWPHKYIIDIHGRVVYDHIGEGGDDNTEAEIVKQLNIRMQFLNQSGAVSAATTTLPDYGVSTRSPETYFGAMRNEYFGNGAPRSEVRDTFTVPEKLSPNLFYLGGDWNIAVEYAEAEAAGAAVSYVFDAANLYMVAEVAGGKSVSGKVMVDGAPIDAAHSGDDVHDGKVTIDSSRLHRIYKSAGIGAHRIDIIFSAPGVRLYTLTFG